MSNSITLKFNKRFLINVLLFVAVLLALLVLVELGIIAYSLKTGALCK
ncbi:hypothetical protein KJ885_03755 [Patescibacteria group bacterium]|nr:hypothetical protein [Patescibacteria group bacterium]